MSRSLSDSSKRAILQLCYAAVHAVAPKYGKYDPLGQAEVAEALTEKIEEWCSVEPDKRKIMEFKTSSPDTYDYLCDILNEVQTTLPFMNYFNVKLCMQRLVRVEDHDTPTVDRNPTGEVEDLDD